MKRFALSLALLLGFAGTAIAYVPTAARMLELWYGAQAKSQKVIVTGKLTIGADQFPIRVLAKEDGIQYEVAGKPATDSTSNFVFSLLFRPERAVEWLKSRGLDVNKTGLARHEGRIAYTLGALGERQKGTQIWLDRELLVPVLVLYDPEGERLDRLVFRNYQESENRRIPKEIEATVKGAVRTYRIEGIERVP